MACSGLCPGISDDQSGDLISRGRTLATSGDHMVLLWDVTDPTRPGRAGAGTRSPVTPPTETGERVLGQGAGRLRLAHLIRA
jgi:hypothetical protein